MTKKNIVIATDNFPPRIDGIARFVEMLLPHLSDFSVTIICPNYGELSSKYSAYTIHRQELQPFMIGDYRPAQKPSSEINPILEQSDIVFVQTLGPIGGEVIRKAHALHKKIIAYVHSIEWQLVHKSLSVYNPLRILSASIVKNHVKNLYNKCSAIIVPSANIAELYQAHGITVPKHIIHLGIDVNHFKPSNKVEAKKKLSIDPTTFVIGYVGRIAREKNLITLVKAFNKIDSKKLLLIVGSGIPALEKQITSTDCIITGPQENVVPYLQAMDVFVMPSFTETTCLAALEAMSCEIPIVSTRVGNLREYIINKENGMFFPVTNDTVLSLKLRYLKENSYEREYMAKNARKTVLADYRWDKTAESIVELLKQYSSE